MKDKVILTDADGVLIDWLHGFNKWMEGLGYVQRGDSSSYDVHTNFGLERAECKKLVRYFNESAEIRYLTPLRDAIKYVKKLHEEHGFVFRCITSLSLNKSAAQLRNENLKELFGPTVFEDITCLDTGADKDDALEPYRDSECFWVEDKPENADLGVTLGLNSLLIAHEFNADYDGNATRVQNWKEVYEIISGQK